MYGETSLVADAAAIEEMVSELASKGDPLLMPGGKDMERKVRRRLASPSKGRFPRSKVKCQSFFLIFIQ